MLYVYNAVPACFFWREKKKVFLVLNAQGSWKQEQIWGGGYIN